MLADDDDEEATAGAVRYPVMPSLVSLQQMRNRLHMGHLGRKLMKWTSIATGTELRRISAELLTLYDTFAEDMREAFIMLARCRYFFPDLNKMVIEDIQSWASVTVASHTKTITGVRIIEYFIVETDTAYDYLGLGQGGEMIEETKRFWIQLLKLMIKMAELRTSFALVEAVHKAATKECFKTSLFTILREVITNEFHNNMQDLFCKITVIETIKISMHLHKHVSISCFGFDLIYFNYNNSICITMSRILYQEIISRNKKNKILEQSKEKRNKNYLTSLNQCIKSGGDQINQIEMTCGLQAKLSIKDKKKTNERFSRLTEVVSQLAQARGDSPTTFIIMTVTQCNYTGIEEADTPVHRCCPSNKKSSKNLQLDSNNSENNNDPTPRTSSDNATHFKKIVKIKKHRNDDGTMTVHEEVTTIKKTVTPQPPIDHNIKIKDNLSAKTKTQLNPEIDKASCHTETSYSDIIIESGYCLTSCCSSQNLKDTGQKKAVTKDQCCSTSGLNIGIVPRNCVSAPVVQNKTSSNENDNQGKSRSGCSIKIILQSSETGGKTKKGKESPDLCSCCSKDSSNISNSASQESSDDSDEQSSESKSLCSCAAKEKAKKSTSTCSCKMKESKKSSTSCPQCEAKEKAKKSQKSCSCMAKEAKKSSDSCPHCANKKAKESKSSCSCKSKVSKKASNSCPHCEAEESKSSCSCKVKETKKASNSCPHCEAEESKSSCSCKVKETKKASNSCPHCEAEESKSSCSCKVKETKKASNSCPHCEAEESKSSCSCKVKETKKASNSCPHCEAEESKSSCSCKVKETKKASNSCPHCEAEESKSSCSCKTKEEKKASNSCPHCEAEESKSSCSCKVKETKKASNSCPHCEAEESKSSCSCKVKETKKASNSCPHCEAEESKSSCSCKTKEEKKASNSCPHCEAKEKAKESKSSCSCKAKEAKKASNSCAQCEAEEKAKESKSSCSCKGKEKAEKSDGCPRCKAKENTKKQSSNSCPKCKTNDQSAKELDSSSECQQCKDNNDTKSSTKLCSSCISKTKTKIDEISSKQSANKCPHCAAIDSSQKQTPKSSCPKCQAKNSSKDTNNKKTYGGLSFENNLHEKKSKCKCSNAKQNEGNADQSKCTCGKNKNSEKEKKNYGGFSFEDNLHESKNKCKCKEKGKKTGDGDQSKCPKCKVKGDSKTNNKKEKTDGGSKQPCTACKSTQATDVIEIKTPCCNFEPTTSYATIPSAASVCQACQTDQKPSKSATSVKIKASSDAISKKSHTSTNDKKRKNKESDSECCETKSPKCTKDVSVSTALNTRSEENEKPHIIVPSKYSKKKLCPVCSQEKCASVFDYSKPKRKDPPKHKCDFDEEPGYSKESLPKKKSVQSAESLCQMCEVKLAVAKFMAGMNKKPTSSKSTNTCAACSDEREIKSSNYSNSCCDVGVGSKSCCPDTSKNENKEEQCPVCAPPKPSCPSKDAAASPRDNISECSYCPKMKDASTMTAVSNRYDVRTISNFAPPPQKKKQGKTCTCTSDSYLTCRH
ncbi:balbiani ring protein 3-like isoform X1 [Plodia interpunctella]|uniref:balbiani ring protein 3-like isoform X1 n=1 Tax=Plodia interpunctella TaxID=58824 RepID=UPI002367B475|nr:balbiani ring protein 3-like isoform X1 [Plodia interpunctella]